ncbi:MAG TPA: ABC transporter permease [Thermoanaerobaculia bacterium]|jgi:putative ABC transport system permease protein|nr:ABC transporter permease [Thermoanaerobaculia bacterium]
MDLRTILPEALGAMAANKLRTGLTMLGITIGIAAVICTVAIGEGGSNRVREQLQSLGDNFIWVEAGSRNVQGVRTGSGATKTLTVRDMEAIRAAVPLVKSVSPNVDGRTQVIYGHQNWSSQYRGVSPEYLAIRRWTVARGASFTHQDVTLSANVGLLGQTVVEALFGGVDPVGRTIRIGNQPVRVVGVLAPKGETATGQDQDDTVLLPSSTVQHKIKGISWLDDIMCSAISPEAIRPAKEQIVRLLRQRHHLRAGAADDFNLRSPEEILEAQQETSRTFTILLASIASISLLVGGIGIMNIMFVTVTERTREIGVRRAMGATRASVQTQFLVEAVLLCALSGAAGVLLGFVASTVFAHALGWVMIIPPRAIVIAVLFSGLIGVGFGFYPARKAALLDPIEALRYE